MREHYLAIQPLLNCGLASVRIHCESNNMGGHFCNGAAVQPTDRQDIASYSIFVSLGKVVARNDEAGEKHSWIRAVLPWRCWLSLQNRGGNPFRSHDVFVNVIGNSDIVWEVDGSGDDMSDFFNIQSVRLRRRARWSRDRSSIFETAQDLRPPSATL